MALRGIVVLGAVFFLFILSAGLRFYKIDQVPRGLYIDEVSIGYNAYTILHSGKDEYGVAHPLFFKAFGEYKLPIPIYLTSASMAIFGRNEFAVRFPSALFGTLTIFFLYFLAQELWKDRRMSFAAAFLLAISPWHIQFSRGEFEANIALFFYVVAAFCLVKFVRTKTLWLFYATNLLLVLTVYTYNSYKLIAPLTLGAVFFLIYKTLPKIRKHIVVAICAVFLLLLPMVLFSLSADGNHRFAETSVFAQYDSLSLTHKLWFYPVVYLKNYLSYFSLPFLFITSDGNGRHTIPGMGLVYHFEFVLLIAGFFYLFKRRKELFARMLLFILVVAPSTAALTQPSPHTLRSLLLVLPLTLISAYGCFSLWKKNTKIIKALFVVLLLFFVYEFTLYLHLYYIHYPAKSTPDWGSGYKDVITQIEKDKKGYDHIVVNNNLGKIGNYINFYDDKLPYQLVYNGWHKPKAWKNERVLYITSAEKTFMPTDLPHTYLKDTYMVTIKKDAFAEFWEL